MDTGAIIGQVVFILFTGFMLHMMAYALVQVIVYASRNSNASFSDIDFPYFYTPATLYKHTRMNWFGCVVVFILLLPLGFVFELGGIIGWLFTCGRND